MRDKVLLRYSRRATAPSTAASLDLVLELLVQRCLVQHWTRLILDQLFVYLSSPIVSWPIICQAQSSNYLSTNYLSSPVFHRQCLHPRQVVEGGRDRRMGRRGNKLVRKIWFNLSKQKERHYLRRYTGCLFFTGTPPKSSNYKKLISARLGVSRPIYVNVDSPNLGFPYFNFLGGYQWKNTQYIGKC